MNSNTWQPLSTAPKDKIILVAWGTVASGAMGYDIVQWKCDDIWESDCNDRRLPSGGYTIIGWMPLPSLP